MHINLLHLPLFNFAYLFFLSLSLNIFVSFIFIALFPSWHPALVFPFFFLFVFLQFVFQLVLFLTDRYNFWFPFFTGSIYCTLLFLDCFDFAYGYICIFSHNFYCCQKPLLLCWAFAVLWSFPFFIPSSIYFSLLFFIILIF